ncbi:hypothetical protein CDL15_Pgr026792 [Punica granatum]|uniref:Uncharacterized protein n=1 Tax=Punica granatum TaxID=22663 RepID=A0A218WNX1_PUNGR|nr:hypothetical protein CDL15_Pgr026792 [Punica granatum]PKI36377.1 hypothetical protein CRG98_043239 [Punica granatum]
MFGHSPFGYGVLGLAQLPPPPTLKNPPSGMDEVEQLLQVAHDDVLLKFSLNSHVARLASHSLDLDLSRRFQALKSPPPSPSLSRPKPSPPPPQVDDELKVVLGDDLSARFAALRFPSSFLILIIFSFCDFRESSPSRTSLACDGRDRDSSCSNPNNEEDEVEKIIQWPRTLCVLIPLLHLMNSLVAMTRMRIATLK